MKLTTHVLDLAQGRPGVGIAVRLLRVGAGAETPLAVAVTTEAGRTDEPLAQDLPAGAYELRFAVGAYFASAGISAFYDVIPVRFRIDDAERDYHVPLLISAWGYTTYLGR